MRLVVPLMVAALALTGCGGQGGGSLGGAGQAAGGSDINPQPRGQVRDGGTLRLPMDIFPNNFNYNQVDGTGSDNLNIDPAVLPSLFTGTADGELKPNPDYLTSVTLTSTAPQVVTYTLNPKATWSDGTPLSWRDFAAYWHSQNGSDPAYETSGTSGYSSISSVTRGVDDRQAVVTFNKPFAEWRNLFGPFAPASLSSTPQAFNTGWKIGMPVTAGPFTIGSIDPVAKTVTLKRDPKWWGTPAKLDQIIFKQYDPAALPDALANNELDYYEIASDINLLRRAQTTPGAVIRDALGQYRTQLTFNGAAGSPLADLALRQAVAQGIDRAAITQRMLGPIEPNAHPAGNHIYSPGAKEYQDNAGVLPYDPGKAQQALDSLGWVRQGNTRVKEGKPLSLRVVFGSAAPTNEDIFRTLQNQLGQIGVTLVAQPLSQPELFPNISRGNFDLALFSWGSTLSPISSTVEIYGQPLGDVTRENYGRVGTPRIDDLFAKGVAELDDAKRADIGNQIDRLIWQQVHSVVLYARPGAVAERDNIANFGAFGLADTDYINAGFVK
ncbi:MAG TPA: ABC transporter family substrate-binding protein [Pseudonocardia sp.]|jgi:peptide/nickel transport system substrate-binding protein|uniref:ABC transporter family substrate-binding protein n=1 Tax=Pseudonocardia sp. TaxID=60912 RepID=UPI002F418099